MTIKIRAQQITIELPIEESEPWIRAIIQTVIKDKDYDTIQVIDRTAAINRRLSEFATMRKTITDPVSGETFTISGIGLGLIISTFVKQWMLDDIQGSFENDNGDVIIKRD